MALTASLFDCKIKMPEQLWYDQLRESDDGRFSNSALNNSAVGMAKSVAERKN